MIVGPTYRHAGEWRTLADIARLTGINRMTLQHRLDRGMTMAEALETKSNVKQYTFAGKTQTLTQWSKETGISAETLRERIVQSRWPIERALTEPAMNWQQRALRKRNQRLIERMIASFNTATGGYDQTFPLSQGTGVGRHVRDLQSQSEKIQ